MKNWGEMSDEEQGALLLAHHRGEVIQFKNDFDTPNWKTAKPFWVGWCYYRVKKEPVVEVRREVVSFGDDLYAVSVSAQCTYTDGKLTKIHWKADQ